MELTKTIESINSLSNKVKNAYKNDIEKTINKLMEEYDIFKRGTDNLITKTELYKLFLEQLESEINYCSAATKSGTRCRHKSLDNAKFCSKHLYSTENLREFLDRTSRTKNTKNNHDYDDKKENLYVIKEESYEEKVDNSNLKNILIDDAFYYTDTKWIYDKKTLKKVGYVDNNDETNEINYILTTDPFILELKN